MNLIVKNIFKSYDNITVLDNINIKIDDVSSIGIIGESGCGKSTLLRLLAGIENPDSGKILINGISPINNKIKFQNNIGYVFQNHNLFPHLTIRQNVYLILSKIKKIKDADKITDKVLNKMFIENIADKLPCQISGGQAQRASIARAIATDPQLIFLDEPTASLDPILTNEVLKSVKNLRQKGRSFIFITHEISFLKEFADFYIFMRNGQIHEYGDINCIDHPETPELSNFLKIY